MRNGKHDIVEYDWINFCDFFGAKLSKCLK